MSRQFSVFLDPNVLTYVDIYYLSSVLSETDNYELYIKYLKDHGVLVNTNPVNAMYWIRKSKPYDLTIVTGPEGVSRWLGLPRWVKLYVWPDEYEVKERVSPLVQELLWQGVELGKAKGFEKKAPSVKNKQAMEYFYSVGKAEDWPDEYDAGVQSIHTISNTEYTSLDFETDAAYKFKAFSTGLAVGNQKDEQIFAGYYKYPDADKVQADAWYAVVQTSTPVFHNASFDMGVAKGKGWVLPKEFEDTMLMAFSAGLKYRDDRSLIGLKVLAKQFLGREMRELSDFITPTELSRHGTLNADPVVLAEYARADAKATLELLPVLREKAVTQIYELEKRLVPVVLDMEQAGFPLDPEPLERIKAAADRGQSEIARWMLENCGFEGNMNSNDQLAKLVYDVVGLKVSEYGRSVGEEAMEKYKWHPVCKRIRAFKVLGSLGNEAEALLNQYRECGYAYTNFNQTGASTGRFSSSSPVNLQNKTDTLRKAFVATLVDLMEEAYIPEDTRHMVVYRADYAQIELRIPAAWSGDKAMLGAIMDGESLHKNLHKMILDKGIKIEYRDVKTFDFALFYGADVPRVMEVLGCDEEKAKSIIQAVESSWVDAMAWRQTKVQEALDNMGWNHSMMGRPFYHPDLFSTDYKAYSHATRTAVNKPIQGTAADIMKAALIGVPDLHTKYGGRMRLTVHDEIAGTIPLENWELFKRDLRAVMLEAETRVPLEVEIGYGYNWKDAKPK